MRIATASGYRSNKCKKITLGNPFTKAIPNTVKESSVESRPCSGREQADGLAPVYVMHDIIKTKLFFNYNF